MLAVAQHKILVKSKVNDVRSSKSLYSVHLGSEDGPEQVLIDKDGSVAVGEKFEVVSDLDAYDLIVCFVFVGESALFDIDDILAFHSLSVDHAESHGGEEIRLHVEEDGPDSELLQVV